MIEELKRINTMKCVYEEQIKNLKDEWKEGKSKFTNIKDYYIQLNIWGNRVAQYDEQINNLKNIS
ncbi:hypothetical protein MZM54_02075 [[Brevibacterium] frigoritolerans]|nr:hypothetical protein [Peribacillus frigoritolerans]